MPLLLSLETSTDVCSVALHEKDILLKHVSIEEPQAHASKLAPLIRDLLASVKLTPDNISAVAVSSGPGSYTGLRIGASTAKGLCYALGKPLIAILTLQVLAKAAMKSSVEVDLMCPMIDARRMEVYCQIFDRNLRPQSSVEAKVLEPGSFGELLADNKVLFCGNGSFKARDLITGGSAFFADHIVPSAVEVGELAWIKFEKSEFENLSDFKPFYLKEFVAKKAQPLL